MNNNHYPAGSSGGKGGQFAPKNVSEAGASSSASLSYVPQVTSKGTKRVFFPDLPKAQQRQIEKQYEDTHSDIVKVLDYFYDNHRTSLIDSEERNFMRQSWINDEFNEQMAQGPKKQERKATLVLGLPGSGKSTISGPLTKSISAFLIDADNFKNRIPEFQKDKKMVSAVHHESVNLADTFRNELAKNGYNMVISKVGGDFPSVKDILDTLSHENYQIDVILVDVPFEEAIDRTIGRFDRGETDRYVPFYTTKVADKNIFKTFDTVLEHPSVVGGSMYSNDVPNGSAPQLLKEFKK